MTSGENRRRTAPHGVLAAGTVLGRFEILSLLSVGGMAEIFLGIQHGAEGFQKPVVLKRVLTAFSADPQFRNMFLDEAHISMSLNHSNVVQVLDLGVSRGRYFLVLELVDGWDLDKIMHRAKAASMVWPPALSLYVVAEVCRALAFAHSNSAGYGAFAGYNGQWDDVVLGVEANYIHGGFKSTSISAGQTFNNVNAVIATTATIPSIIIAP